jgi:hypothetical protein
VIIRKYEDIIIRINFYSGEEILVKVGLFSDDDIKRDGGRLERFDIAEDEQLIGCKFDQYQNHYFLCRNDLCGITWMKIKLPRKNS